MYLDEEQLMTDGDVGISEMLMLYKQRHPEEFAEFILRTPGTIHGESLIAAWEAYQVAHPDRRHFFRFARDVARGVHELH